MTKPPKENCQCPRYHRRLIYTTQTRNQSTSAPLLQKAICTARRCCNVPAEIARKCLDLTQPRIRTKISKTTLYKSSTDTMEWAQETSMHAKYEMCNTCT